MTAPLSPWPPTKETLAELGQTLIDECDCEYDPEAGHEPDCFGARVAAFLRDPRLAAALELWEAVEWIEANRPAIYRERGRWGALHGDTDVIGKTLPEAVSALRARLEKESSRG